jgi:predicted lipid-binding transport protein (Tim44 family)
MADSQLLEIILIATVAGVILFRLYSVLGRRTGNERSPEDYRLPDRQPASRQRDGAVPTGEVSNLASSRIVGRPVDPVLSGLFDISLADRNFDKDKFLAGARSAYEMIETAFANADQASLRPLLSEPVYAAFETALKQRLTDNQTCNFTFIGFKDVKIIAAELKNTVAEITVSFSAQFISAVRDGAGNIVEGDDKTVRQICDIWTFARDVHARNPNWVLTATTSG